MSTTFDRRLLQTIRKVTDPPKEELNRFKELSEEVDSPLFDALVDQGCFEEKQLLGMVAVESGTTPIDLERLVVDDEALEIITQEIAERHRICPVAVMGGVLTIAVADPFDVVKFDHLRLLLKCELRTVLASDRAIGSTMDRLYRKDDRELEELIGSATSTEDIHVTRDPNSVGEAEDLSLMDDDSAPVIKLTNMIIANAIKNGASDIHIEPFEDRLRVRYREDGVLYSVLSPPRNLAGAIASRIKIMAGLDIAEKRKPQDGKFQVKMEGRSVDFRVSTLPIVHGEKIVLRVLDNSSLAKKLASLGFEKESLSDFEEAIRSPHGMILITGPTGSGKSTTLYSAVKELYSEETNFVTVEDPVEYQLDGINQVPVNIKRGVTFSSALRSILRQDPDTILIGEIRDSETIEIAVKAALTGHLVLSTLHTNDAASAITRMSDMGLDPFLVATSVVMVAAQRLCRRLCSHCRKPIEIPDERLLALGFTREEVGTAELYEAVGCTRCHQGFKGRFAIIETLVLTDDIKSLILESRSAIEIKQKAREGGMVTLRRAAIQNALRGLTSLDEVLRVTMSDS